jgi:hypothetical protein
MKYMKKSVIIIVLMMVFSTNTVTIVAQQIDFNSVGEVFKKKPVKITGGIAANSVFYGGNESYTRDPWNYFLSGTVNFSIYEQLNVPLTLNLTNSGANMAYPTLPNRFSIHPTYKWITGHLGDVSMNFSPYTLNGHQFTGGGVDLTPNNWKISAMVGRLQRKVDYNSDNPSILPAYRRMGYGTQIRYEKEKYKIGVIGFYAADQANNPLSIVMDSLSVFPQRNLVVSWNASLQIIKNLQLSIEHAHSILTADMRAATDGNTWLSSILDRRASTQNHNAFHVNLNYQLWKNTIGLSYERIDPEYATLGAYYFNNDYENVALNYARPFFSDKLNLALNAGVQRDNLDNDNETNTNRFVGALTLSYVPSENITTNFSYSNFQTHTNVKSPFDYINQTIPTENLDTLDFSQLSQNAALMVVYNFGKQTKEAAKHTLSFDVNFQETADKHDNIIYTGDLSRFYTMAVMYGIMLPPSGIRFTSSVNLAYNDMETEDAFTCGPSVGIAGQFLEKKMSAGISTSYNVSFMQSVVQNNIFNVRANASYMAWKRHNFMASVLYQFRRYIVKNNTHGITVMVGYAYNF